MKKSKITGFSLVEILIALIIVSLITAAMAPVITKKLKSSGITIGGGGGSGGGFDGISSCPDGLYLNIETKTCEICPAGSYCDGVNKIPCAAGTFSANRATECSECAEGYYSPEGAEQCLLNTAQNCAEKSKTENACISCNGDYALVDGNCVSSIPVYKLVNSSGADITSSATELTKDSSYWYIKIKSSGTLNFTSIPANLIDVFTVGGGAGARKESSTCSSTSAANGGGGSYNILKNVVISTTQAYTITIGSGGASAKCSFTDGGTTSAFGIFTHGGRHNGNHSVCPFNDASCTLKYGETGTSSNQTANTGNGGKSSSSGMSGAVILRGSLNPKNASTDTIPSYKFSNSAGSDITTTNSTLSVDDTYWYLRFTAGGEVIFNSLPNSFIDAFIVGGGAGARTTSSTCDGTSARAGGGGNNEILRNVLVTTNKTYPISIGSGASATKCSNPDGGTSGGFGAFAYGGRHNGDNCICPFGDATCDYKFGCVGTTINQNNNTGNGGASGYTGLNGIVIIRGKRTVSNASPDLPVYKFLNSSGSDTTTTHTSLNIDNNYWYIKYTQTGNTTFDYLPTDFVDIFVVGGGAGARTESSTCSSTSASAGGGGTYNISRNVYLSNAMTYPISIGSGGASAKCSFPDGGTTSAFGIYSRGGLKATAYSICPFGESSCSYKYGNTGSTVNQNPNTGNGGTTSHAGTSGTIIIRGKIDNPLNVADKIPTYRYTNSSASDITNSASVLSVTDTHWYITFTKAGKLKFNTLNNSKIDIFVVGGGAGARTESSTCSSTSASAGGGGTYNILTNATVSTSDEYTITIGSGGAAAKCNFTSGGASSFTTSNTSNPYSVSASGGSGTTSHSVCLFNEPGCTYTYGNTGSNTNQFQNTGNGAATGLQAMNGVVVIRGTL